MNRKTRDKVAASKNSISRCHSAGSSFRGKPDVQYAFRRFCHRDSSGRGSRCSRYQKGDIIEKLDDQKVTGNQDLVEKLQYYEAGETVEVVVARADDGEYKDITMEVTLGTRPQE